MKKWAFLLGLTMSLSTQAEPIIRIFEMQIRPESVQKFTELGKNNIRQSSRLSQHKQNKLIEQFVAGATA
ncbi:hypothetical protein [Glaesserella sp.]|uniref:hypothetical protein n=1 Tax=Glaesserella sp. TaxID=2094731 RepID=UPI00359F9F9B